MRNTDDIVIALIRAAGIVTESEARAVRFVAPHVMGEMPMPDLRRPALFDSSLYASLLDRHPSEIHPKNNIIAASDEIAQRLDSAIEQANRDAPENPLVARELIFSADYDNFLIYVGHTGIREYSLHTLSVRHDLADRAFKNLSL